MEKDAGIKMKCKDIGSFEFAQTIQKIAATPTQALKASQIRSRVSALQKVRELVSESYREEVMVKFGEKNPDGSLKHPEGEPQGFIPIADKTDEIMKANEEFGEKEFTIQAPPLTPSLISDVKLSAKELESLKDFFSDEEGPGVPHLKSMN